MSESILKSAPEHKLLSKTTITATLGTLLEWAEYTFFAYMADQLSNFFFDIQDANLARLKTYGIFATSYFMRPLGAILFGTLGDKMGRKPALMSSMLLMGIATVSIGCLPTYAEVGSLAAILLLVCRLLQGIAVGGEFHGAITFLHEHAEKRPFFIGSFAPFAAAGGMAIGSFAATLTLLPGAPAWSWRIPFLCSGFLCLLALYLRSNIEETQPFQRAKREKRLVQNPIFKVFKEQKKALLLTACISIFVAVYVYIGNIFFKITCINVGGLRPEIASQIVTFGQVLAACLILICGRFADKIGGKRMCLTGLTLAIIAGPIILATAQTGDVLLTISGQVLYAIVNGLVSSSMMTLLMQEFHTETRYSGSAFGWSISAAIFGGTALMVADILMNQLGLNFGPGLYISLASGIAAIAILMTSTPSKHSTLANSILERPSMGNLANG